MSPAHPLDAAIDFCDQHRISAQPVWMSEEVLEITFEALWASCLRGDLSALAQTVPRWCVWIDGQAFRQQADELVRREYTQAAAEAPGRTLDCQRVSNWERLMRCTEKLGEVAREWYLADDLESAPGVLITDEELDPDGLAKDVRKAVELAMLLLSWIAYILNKEEGGTGK